MTSVGPARTFAADLLAAAGVPADNARRTAELLVLADVWGIGSHGLMRLPYYLARLTAGGVNADATMKVVREAGAAVSFDGNDGLGHWQLWAAAEVAAERAAKHGIAVASVGSSSHSGCLGLYTAPALRAGLISVVFSTGPAVMAAPGTATPLLSTSPLAAGIPCRPNPAVIDLATSAVARGKIAAHARRGEPLEDGWAVDTNGVPTTNPMAALAGMLAPLGGGKGFALAFLVEAMTAGVVGPALAGDIPDMFNADHDAQPQRIAHVVIGLDPAVLAIDDGGQTRLDELADRVAVAGGRVPGSARPMPWEVADDRPVAVSTDVMDELATWATRLGTDMRGPVGG